MENIDHTELGSLYYQHLPYPVFYISRDKIISGNNSFRHFFGENSIGENLFSLVEITDENNNKISTLLDIGYNKIYLLQIKNPNTDTIEGKVFFDIVSSNSNHYLVATIIFSISNDVDLSLELAHERQCRIDNEDELITHVGVLLPKNKIIHASGSVRVDKVDHQGIFNEENNQYTHNLRLIKKLI